MDRASRKAHRTFYEPHPSVGALLETGDAVCSHRYPLHGAVLNAPHGLRRILDRFEEQRRKLRGFAVEGQSPFLMHVPVSTPARPSSATVARAFIWQDGADGLVCVLGARDEAAYLVHELRRYFTTDLASIFFRTRDLPDSLGAAAKSDRALDIRVTGYTANVLMAGDDKRVKTRREWLPEPEPFQEFFADLDDEREWIRSLTLHLCVDDEHVARGRVRRDMSFACDAGFPLFFHHVIRQLRQTIATRRGLFEKRSAEETGTGAVKPLQITYESRVFEDPKANHRLIRVLRRLPDSALSVFHPNPYMHAAVMDYADGSSFTLWITDDASLLIVPGRRTTGASLERFCNHVNENFGEGRIQEVNA